jgi:HPt (histidine-containing phosphotransfer) domain-containing protein
MEKDNLDYLLANGITDYVFKPVDFFHMKKTIEKHVQNTGNSQPELSGISDKTKENRDIFDKQELLNRIGYDDALFTELIEMTPSLLGELIDKLGPALNANDPALFKTLIHELKGMAANLSASRLHRAARQMETASDNGNKETINKQLARVEKEYRLLLSRLSKEMKNH